MEEAGFKELSSKYSYNVDNFVQDALEDENYSASEITSTNLDLSYDETTSSCDNDEELQHTIRTCRKMINSRRKKIRSSSLSSSETYLVGQEPMLQYRKNNLPKRISLLSYEEEKQLCIMNQASKVIKLCKNSKNIWSSERVESERIFSLAVHRLDRIFDETQNLIPGENSEICSFVKGTVQISKISLKLNDGYIQDCSSKNYDNVAWFMCIVQHKYCVYGTQAISICDVEDGHISFPDSFTFYDLETDFLIKIEVLILRVKNKDSERTKKCWHKFNRHWGIGLHPPRKVLDSSSLSDLQSIRSEITGFCVDSYMEINKYDFFCKPHNLKKISQCSPLSGTMNFELCNSLSVNKIVDGFLTMYGEIGGFGNWERRWFVLSDFTLKYWNYPFEANTKAPIGSIDLKYTLTDTIQLTSRIVCPRPRTMLIDIKNSDHTKGSGVPIKSDETRYLLSADTVSEVKYWCEIINHLLCCLRDWDLMKS